MNERTAITIQWAVNYIEQFKKNYELDPLQFITGETDKQHALFYACVDLITTIETAADDFRKERDKIAL